LFNQPQHDLKAAIERRGGAVAENVSGRLRYLVVGSAGSTEWKYGTFGTKIEKAMLIKEEKGAALFIISEDQLVTSLGEAP
jgi:NAD-dependent DNA ligase